VNKFVIRQDGNTDKQINIPVELKWDYLGLDMAIQEYEKEVITEVIGVGRDFEISRFAHAPATGTTNSTEINYEFYFYSGGSMNDINNWRVNYLSEGFTPQEVYYYENNFTNSFFKLDYKINIRNYIYLHCSATTRRFFFNRFNDYNFNSVCFLHSLYFHHGFLARRLDF
jgi:hypothetical protein